MTTKPQIILLLAVGLIIGWLTIFRGYTEPASFYWDENYHIASAQKYLNQVFFQEPHPPLGKLLIAAGESLLDANPQDDQFIETNHASTSPPDFSFAGYRFFPVLLAALTVPLFGLLGFQLSGSLVAGIICIAAFGFDNALVVHLRGAMLEGPQLFFLIGSAVSAIAGLPIVAGLCAGAAIATKVNSAPALILVTAACFQRNRLKGLLWFTFTGALIWCVVWQTHFLLGQRLLTDKYKSSQEYQTAIKEGHAGSPELFVPAISQALSYFADYQTGVPTLNMCKTQENGSYPLLWPLGAQSINYRWDRKDGATSYLYLQANPAVWLFSLLGILWAARSFSVSQITRMHSANRGVLACAALLALYAASILLPLYYARVFYLYHFFIPLLTGVLVGAIYISRATAAKRQVAATLCFTICAIFFGTFQFFAPLTYSKPLTDEQLLKRAWLPLWNLRCASCSSIFPIARPLENDGASIAISGQKALSVTQGWGVTRMGLTDENAPLLVNDKRFDFGIGTHANGEMTFAIPKWASAFAANVGVPDAYRGRKTSIEFAILVDETEVWRSPTMRPGEPAAPVAVPVSGKNRIALKITDAGDGIDDDHGAWLEPVFK